MKNRKLKLKNIILTILIVIFLISSIILGIYFLHLYQNKKNYKSLIDKVVQIEKNKGQEEEKITIDFETLQSINSDIIGWIRWNHNKVNYPIVHTKNNDYYLTHSFDKKYNQAGAIFMDYRNTSLDNQNVVLFGHSMLDGSMFASVADVFEEGFFDTKNNDIIEVIDTNNTVYHYQIFSYYRIEKEEYYITPTFESEQDYMTFLSTLKQRSYKDFGVELSIDDTILTLSTCYGIGNTSQRMVIHAKRI